MRIAAFLALVSLFSFLALAQTGTTPKVYTEDDLKELRGGISVIGEAPAKPSDTKDEPRAPGAAKQKSKIPDKAEGCADWAVASAISAALGAQGVAFDASYWIDKIYGGTRCPKSIGGLSSIAASVDGDYTLDDASKVRVQTKIGVPGAGGMVENTKGNRPMLVIWQGVPYVSQGVRYVKEVYSDGSILYKIKEMELTNPYLDKTVTFHAERDREGDLEAMEFAVTTRQ